MPRHLSVWLILMAVAGFCSFIYELALAQLLTGLLGGAMTRFATTLGVYIVALGIGAVSFNSKSASSARTAFFRAELFLFSIGLFSPALFVLFQRLSLFNDLYLQNLFVLTTTHALIFTMGFFCGREVPILSSLISHELGENDLARRTDGLILAADYGGMFLASVAFPFLLFPYFGLISTFAFATLLNLVAASVTYYLMQTRSALLSALLIAFLIMNAAALIYSTELQFWLSRAYSSAT